MFHGGATKKAFTYGKRGRTAVAATSDSDANASSVDEEPKLVLPSRAQKVDYSHKNAVSKHADRGTISTPVKKQAARSDTLSKPKASKNLHNDKVTSPAHARASKVSRQKTKLNNVELLHPSPRRVRVDISTLDQTGRAIKYEVRMNKVADNLLQSMIPGSQLKPEPPKASHAPIGHGTPQRTHRRPTAPSYTQKPAPLRVAAPCASKKSRQNETTDATVLDSPDEEVASVFSSSSSTKASPPALPTKRGVRKNPIVISSDESGWERPSAKAHPGSAHQRTFGAPPTQQRSRVFGRPSQSSLEKLPGQSTPRRVSGINRPRQLTPTIDRYSRSSIPSRHSEPRKSESLIESDLDLSLEIAGLDISSSFDDSGLTKEDTLQPKYIHELLDECRQTTPHEFSAFVEAFPLDPVVNPHDIPSRIFVFRKVGEASFSEVFGIGSVVLKIVPLHDESTSDAILTNDETPSPSKASDLVKEITVTRSMADVCGDAFVRLLKAYVVRGKYPSKLLALWDDYEDDNGSENVRPDGFPPSQIYAIIVLPNGGADLEHYQFTDAAKTGWRQAYSVFWQVAHALDQAEQKLKFEHRDLHWGQILVQTTKPDVSKDVRVHVTIIDFGFSRMDMADSSGRSAKWTEMEEEVFEGQGEYQFDVYRLMREHNGDRWDIFKPLTNLMWLHYLCLKLLHAKKLRPPSQLASPQASTSKSLEYEHHRRLLNIERLLAASLIAWIPSQKAVIENATLTKASKVEGKVRMPSSAGSLVKLAKKQGWKVD